MPTNRDIQLETEFLHLLREADPEVSESDPLVHEFASHLATLTDDWATGSPRLSARERWLAQWIEENTGQPLEVAASNSDELELVEAGGEAEAEAGVDA